MTERTAYDPFAPHRGASPQRPRRSTSETALPSWLFDALRERGVPDDAVAPLADQFERLTPAEKASALAEMQNDRHNRDALDELAAALVEYHAGGPVDVDDGDVGRFVDVRVAAGDEGDEMLVAADAEELVDRLHRLATALDVPPAEVVEAALSALDGSDDALTPYGLSLVAGEPLDRWGDLVTQVDLLLGDDTAAGDAQEAVTGGTGENTSEAVEPDSDDQGVQGDDPGGVLDLSVSVDDVPKNANDAVAWLGDAENDDALRVRARLVLDAELSYPGAMRKTVRQALDLALGESTVQAAIDERG